jgi:hypothetical protein
MPYAFCLLPYASCQHTSAYVSIRCTCEAHARGICGDKRGVVDNTEERGFEELPDFFFCELLKGLVATSSGICSSFLWYQ